MRQLIQEAEGSSVFITPDGPRGPRRHVKQGILFLSSQTSRPILPLGVACSSHWDFQGNWTNLIVPRPLSRIVIYAGSPISVPEDASRETLDAFQTQVESAMVQAEQAAKGRLSLLLGKSLDDQPTDQRRAA